MAAGRRGVGRELATLARPAGSAALWAVERLHWWLAVLAVAYAASGVTLVQPNEVAVLYRFGALVGEGAGAVHPPGLMFALPRPVDRVERVPVATIFESELRDLHFTETDVSSGESKVTRYLVTSRTTLDPERTGYALTGDQNIVHIAMVARWQIADPIAWLQSVDDPEDQLRAAVLSSTVRALGGRSVDAVLSDGRQALVESVSRAAQARLNGWQAGVSLVSLELIDLGPPQQVKEAFRDVQTAAIESETRLRSAEEYRAVQLPRARTERGRAVQAAEAEALERLQAARSESAAFTALVAEHRKDPTVVRERLYREGVEAVLRDAGAVRFVPPPVGGRYTGGRLTVPTGAGGGRDE